MSNEHMMSREKEITTDKNTRGKSWEGKYQWYRVAFEWSHRLGVQYMRTDCPKEIIIEAKLVEPVFFVSIQNDAFYQLKYQNLITDRTDMPMLKVHISDVTMRTRNIFRFRYFTYIICRLYNLNVEIWKKEKTDIYDKYYLSMILAKTSWIQDKRIRTKKCWFCICCCSLPLVWVS